MIGREVGSGGTSLVYEWGEDKVIKIFKSHVTDDVIDNELFIGNLLTKFSLNIPKFYGLITYEGHKALIYERINGKVMADSLLKGTYIKDLALKFAQIHLDIHEKSLNGIPSQDNFLRNRIIALSNILSNKTKSLINLLDSIPIDNKLCHGDFQPLNIIGSTKKYVVIDWNGACSGNPLLDVAWSYMTMGSPIVRPLLGEKIAEVFMHFSRDYLSYYCELASIKSEEIYNVLPIVATRRLYDNLQNDNENSQLEREWLLHLIDKIA